MVMLYASSDLLFLPTMGGDKGKNNRNTSVGG